MFIKKLIRKIKRTLNLAAEEERRFEVYSSQFNSINTRFDSINTEFDSINIKFDTANAKFNSADTKFASIQAQFNSINELFTSIHAQLTSIQELAERVELTEKKTDAELAEVHVSQADFKANVDELTKKTESLEEKFNEIKNNLTIQDDKVNLINNRLISTETKLNQFMYLTQSYAVSKNCDIRSWYEYDRIREIRNLLLVKLPADDNVKFIRLGRNGDGGYVMLDDFTGANVAYSLGISDDVSWDHDLLNHLNGQVEIFQYDHTIEALPEENIHYHWKKIGVCGNEDPDHPELNSLTSMIRGNGHINENNMILKMDVEGAEYETLVNTDSSILNQFSQIVMELHDLNDLSKKELIVAALEHLTNTHQLVHVHGNNYESYQIQNNVILPNALEVTYVRKDRYQFRDSDVFYPCNIDEKNNIIDPEIILGNWGKSIS